MNIDKAEHLITLLTEELKVLQQFAREKDERKNQIFKLSIALFSTFSATVIAVFTLLTRFSANIDHEAIAWFGPLFSILLFGVGVINFILLKHYSEAHVGRIMTAQQANLLRRSQSSIIFYLVEDRLPDSNKELLDPNTSYWRYFGRAQAGEIDNKGLIEREGSAFTTSAGVTMLIMLVMSISALMLPLIYYLNQSNSLTLAITSGAVSTLFSVAGITQIRAAHAAALRRLRDHEDRTNIH